MISKLISRSNSFLNQQLKIFMLIKIFVPRALNERLCEGSTPKINAALTCGLF